jgi:hypothetical protein
MLRSAMRRSVRYVLLSLIYLPVILGPVKATADDHTQMIQFELTFGGKQAVSNLYMSMKPSGFRSQNATDMLATYRMPVISSDPGRMTLFSPLLKLYANDESTNSESKGYEEPNPDASVGNFAGQLLVAALVIVPIAIGISNTASDLDPCRDGCDIELPDLDEIVIPDPPPLPAESGE